MLVFMKEGLVFLSVPKTGTSAFEAALGPRASLVVRDPPELKHAPLYRYDRFFRPMFEKVCGARPETLAVIREPIDWLGSWYRYRQRPFTRGKPVSTHGISFETFVEGYLKGQRPAFADVGSQAKFVSPRPDGPPVDHLFRYESQQELLGFLEARLGQRIDLPQRNVSPEATLALSPELEARLRRKHAADFDLWESLG
ncbi:MAG: gamma-glutamyl kinase [Paracoccaceae bacterium]